MEEEDEHVGAVEDSKAVEDKSGAEKKETLQKDKEPEDEFEFPDYIGRVMRQTKNPSDFAYISDILMADMLASKGERGGNKEFYGNTSVNKIIDKQFLRTVRLYYGLLIIYLLGYGMPVLVTLSYTNKDDEEEQWKRKLWTLVAVVFNLLFWALEFFEIQYLRGLYNNEAWYQIFGRYFRG